MTGCSSPLRRPLVLKFGVVAAVVGAIVVAVLV